MSRYLTRKDVLEKIPQLKMGSWDYWVKYKCRIEPIKKIIRGPNAVEVYKPNCIDEIRKAIGVA